MDAYAKYRYVWGPRYIDELLYRDECSQDTGALVQRLYAMQDANFNVVALAEEDGDVVERFMYDAYGRVTVLDPAFTADADNASDYAWQYLYTARPLDPETGLMDYRNRCYHTGLGRFVSRDPISYEGGINLYEYVKCNPVRRTDPFGLDDDPFTWTPGPVWQDEKKVAAICKELFKWMQDPKNQHELRDDTVGFTECYDGKSVACVLEERIKKFYKSELGFQLKKECTQVHENEHTKQIDCNVKAERRFCYEPLRPFNFRTSEERECAARKAELTCLGNKLKKVKDDGKPITDAEIGEYCKSDRQCEEDVKTAIRVAKEGYEKNCPKKDDFPSAGDAGIVPAK